MPEAETIRCAGCGAELAPALLACPACGALAHAQELKSLAAEAEARAAVNDLPSALAAWRRALELLPAGSRQHAQVTERVTALSNQIDANPAAAAAARKAARTDWSGAGSIGLVGLFLGLTKASTLLSMLFAFGVYWTAWGWKFALGLVVTTYVHEMGHVFALRRYGLRATAPMFIPGVGALVRLQQRLVTTREDAQVGLAGPVWGLAAAAFCWAVALATGWQSWLAVAKVSAWINLFNLLPLGSLDGGRAFAALDRLQRALLAALLGGLAFVTHEQLLTFLAIVAGARALGPAAPPKGDRLSFVEYALLALALAGLASLHVR